MPVTSPRSAAPKSLTPRPPGRKSSASIPAGPTLGGTLLVFLKSPGYLRTFTMTRVVTRFPRASRDRVMKMAQKK